MGLHKLSQLKLRTLIFLYLTIYITKISGQISIDLGSENIKVAILKPGREPISIVLNELSKRKTTAAVSIINDLRYIGEKAFSFQTKYPEKVILRIRDFLGKNISDPTISEITRLNEKSNYPWKLKSDEIRNTIRFSIDEKLSLTMEELIGSLLYYAKMIAEADSNEKIINCVIAVPAFFGPIQKQVILDAAKLVDLKISAIIHTHASAALQYGIDRKFEEEIRNVIFYDMGANSVQVSLASFSAYDANLKSNSHFLSRLIYKLKLWFLDKKKELISQFEVKDVTWLENLGGDHLDWILVDYFGNIFNEQFKHLNIFESHKAIFKLKNAVRKTKHVLSTNTEAPLFVEELYMDQDFNSKITREEFENLASDFFIKAIEPLKLLIQRNKIDISTLTSVELIGGGSRVPKLKEMISNVLNGRLLGKHLDGDEAVTLGAGLVAANLSSVFRLRQFGFIDGVIYPITLQIDSIDYGNWKPSDECDIENILKPKNLLPRMKHLPTKRAVNLNQFVPDSFTFKLLYNVTEEVNLPPGAFSNEYATFKIYGLKELKEKYGEDGKVILHFSADISELITLDKAEFIVDYEKEASSSSVTNDNIEANITAEVSNNDTENLNITENLMNITTEKKEDDEEVLNNKKKRKKLSLKIDGPEFKQRRMDLDEIRKSKNVLKTFIQKEKEVLLAEEAKNELESYIIDQQSIIEADKNIIKITKEEERKKYINELLEIEDWLYMEGSSKASSKTFKNKLKKLKLKGDDFAERASELNLRLLAVEAGEKYIELIKKIVNTWPETKPYVNETEIAKLLLMTSNFETWLNDMTSKQAKLELHEKAAFKSKEVYDKLTELDKLFQKLKKIKPPKPKITLQNVTGDIDNIIVDGVKIEKEEETKDIVEDIGDKFQEKIEL